MSCLTLDSSSLQKFILIDGIRCSPELETSSIIETLNFIDNSAGGIDAFLKTVQDLLNQLNQDSSLILRELKYGIRPLSINYGIFDDLGETIFSGPKSYMDNFLVYSRLSPTIKKTRLDQVINASKKELEKYIFIPKDFISAAGVVYPIVNSLREGTHGYAPDYNLFNDDFINGFVYNGLRENVNIRIKMSGSYTEDFKRANSAVGIDADFIPEGGGAPEGFVWNQLDDFDPVTNECTMQLVTKSIHNMIAPLISSDTGAVIIWKRFFDIVGYRY